MVWPSGSDAVTTAPTLAPAPEFSSTLRLVESSANAGGSSSFVKLIVTEISSVPPAAVATTLTE